MASSENFENSKVELPKEDPELFEHFLAWLYNPKSSLALQYPSDISTLIRLLSFSAKWRCWELHKTIFEMLFPKEVNIKEDESLADRLDLVFSTIKEFIWQSEYSNNNGILKLLKPLSEKMAASIFGTESPVNTLIEVYLSVTKWTCVDQMEIIFDRTQDRPKLPIRKFCVDQLHYGRSSQVEERERISKDERNIIFRDVSGFANAWLDRREEMENEDGEEEKLREDPRGYKYDNAYSHRPPESLKEDVPKKYRKNDNAPINLRIIVEQVTKRASIEKIWKYEGTK
ncbi:hypothetical protein G7Y89_g9756 [Cudoniella acicularis]|uniref:BTB domain-containing protein n=1 Tax=Cudoniella acicularis TaxID=354080 RepID=A0A8H4VZQ0_9HELO|nr:hypothetical protein G7Y89_g9756 [Cudoniella acicularis]